MAKIYRCKHPFAFDADGVSRVVAVDDVVSSDEPAFKGRHDLFANTELFEPVEEFMQRRIGVEQATAAPGEKRSITTPETGTVRQKPEPQRPPMSGAGSGADAWRAYAAAATDTPAETFADLSRDQVIELLRSEGVLEPKEEPGEG